MTQKNYANFVQNRFKLPDYLLPNLKIIQSSKTKYKLEHRLDGEEYIFKVKNRASQRNPEIHLDFIKFIRSITPCNRDCPKTRHIYLVKKKENGVSFKGNISLTGKNYENYKQIIYEAIENLTI